MGAKHLGGIDANHAIDEAALTGKLVYVLRKRSEEILDQNRSKKEHGNIINAKKKTPRKGRTHSWKKIKAKLPLSTQHYSSLFTSLMDLMSSVYFYKHCQRRGQ